MTSKVTYKGGLRTSSVHLASGTEVFSDAPIDNHGKGQAFSPTDSVANALATCMFTVMGIKAEDMGFDLDGATAEVTKHMQSDPRRISAIDIVFTLPSADEKSRTILERTALTCPVYLILSDTVEKNVTFNWS